MALEIEKKFLVLDSGWQSFVTKKREYRQGYLGRADKASTRIRMDAEKAHLNIKSVKAGSARQEFEYEIPFEEGQALLKLCHGPLVEKTRYYVPHGKHIWEVDVFEGDNAGLVVAEIELGAVNEVFEKPSWVGQEVTEDIRYYNTSLSEKPYKTWK